MLGEEGSRVVLENSGRLSRDRLVKVLDCIASRLVLCLLFVLLLHDSYLNSGFVLVFFVRLFVAVVVWHEWGIGYLLLLKFHSLNRVLGRAWV